MTATTTLPGSVPSIRRPLWFLLAFVLAGAAVVIGATIAVTDDGPAAVPHVATAPTAASVGSASAVTVSADAAAARAAARHQFRVTRSPDAAAGLVVTHVLTRDTRSPDAVERWATAEQADTTSGCSSATAPDAVERCLASR